MGDLFEQIDGAYEQTGTDFYEDAYNYCGEEDGPVAESESFLINLNSQLRSSLKPKSWNQRNRKYKVRSINFYLGKDCVGCY